MPDGRFLSRSGSLSRQLATVSLPAAYLFTWCIPHLDREGRMRGSPAAVKATVVPLRADFTEELVGTALSELVRAKMVEWYEVEDEQYLCFPSFHNHQRGWKLDREAKSKCPPPTVGKRVSILNAVPTNSSSTPDLGSLSEVKLRSFTSQNRDGEPRSAGRLEAPVSPDAPVLRPEDFPTDFAYRKAQLVADLRAAAAAERAERHGGMH